MPKKKRSYLDQINIKEGSMNELHTKRFLQIREYYHLHGILPTVQRMQSMFGVHGNFAAYKSVLHMLKVGALKKIGGRFAPGENFDKINLA